MKKDMLYMAVTPDKYELPIFVGNSTEVAEWAGITLNALYSSVYHKRSGSVNGYKLVKVEIK
nr:hypothetical protein [uncultured Cellulosilyticum sp.]